MRKINKSVKNIYTKRDYKNGDIMEEYAYVIDYVPYSKYGEPIVYLIGEKFFSLFEATLKKGELVSVGDRVYIGKDKRDKISKIKRKLTFSALPQTSREALPDVIRKIIESNPTRFVLFVNKAGPISVRVHQLDLIPGIGKKNMEIILEEREKEPFKSFEDIKKRVPSWLDPVGSFVHRIMDELEGKTKRRFFVSLPRPH